MVRVVGVIRVIKVVGVVWADMVVMAARVFSLDDTQCVSSKYYASRKNMVYMVGSNKLLKKVEI